MPVTVNPNALAFQFRCERVAIREAGLLLRLVELAA
jgi:hypothetical protein